MLIGWKLKLYKSTVWQQINATKRVSDSIVLTCTKIFYIKFDLIWIFESNKNNIKLKNW